MMPKKHKVKLYISMGLFWSKLVDLAENILNIVEDKCSFIFGFDKNGSQPSDAGLKRPKKGCFLLEIDNS